MSQTAFGYDNEQDRIWLMFAPERPRIWITRHISQGISTSVTQLVEQTAPGLATGSAAHRVEIEHQLAVNEAPSGERVYPFHHMVETKEQRQAFGYALCTTLSAQIHSAGGSITMLTDDGSDIKFEFSRHDLHLWLRAFRMALQETHWNLNPDLPAWLAAPLLPHSINELLKQPLPADLDEPERESPPPATSSLDKPATPPTQPTPSAPPSADAAPKKKKKK